MSRKINVRSPFYLFVVPDESTTTQTTTDTTTASTTGTTTGTTGTTSGTTGTTSVTTGTTGTTGTTTLLTYSCSIASLSGGSISNSGAITNPNVSDGSVIIKSLTENGSTLTTYNSNTGSARYVTIWFKIQPNNTYIQTPIWCSLSVYQYAAATTDPPTTLPTLTCSIAALTGGSIANTGLITDPSATGGIVIGKSETNGGTLISSVGQNTTTSQQSFQLWFKIQPNGNYNQTPIWCDANLNQAAGTFGTHTYYLTAIGQTSVGGFCSGNQSVTTSIMINSSSMTGAVGQTVYSNGSTTMPGQNRYWIVSNTPYTWNYSGTTPFNWWTISSSGVVTAVGTHTCAAQTTAQPYTQFHISAGRAALGDFCNTSSPVQTIVHVPGTSITYSSAYNKIAYTGSGGNYTSYPGGSQWHIVHNSAMNYSGTSSFNYWQIGSNGMILSSGTSSGCSGSGGGGQIGNEY